MVDPHDFLKPIFATDREFGDDGNLYVSDFVGLNWDGRSVGGRLDTMRHSLADGPEVAEVKSLFAIGFTQRPSPELEKLLAHADPARPPSARSYCAPCENGLSRLLPIATRRSASHPRRQSPNPLLGSSSFYAIPIRHWPPQRHARFMTAHCPNSGRSWPGSLSRSRGNPPQRPSFAAY